MKMFVKSIVLSFAVLVLSATADAQVTSVETGLMVKKINDFHYFAMPTYKKGDTLYAKQDYKIHTGPNSAWVKVVIKWPGQPPIDVDFLIPGGHGPNNPYLLGGPGTLYTVPDPAPNTIACVFTLTPPGATYGVAATANFNKWSNGGGNDP